MNWSARRAQFRTLLAAPHCLHPASVHDPLSARIAEDIGFECGMFAGSTASLAILGAPDLITITLTEFAEQALRISRAGSLPLMTDADHGYGNALNVRRTVEELETAGVAGLTVEDTALPQPFGTTKPSLISIEEGAGKIRAAVQARQDGALVVAARTGALAISGLDDTLARLRAYEQAGPDALFLTGLADVAQLEAIAAATTLPLMLGNAPASLGGRDALAAHRVRIALQGHLPSAAAAQAIHDTLAALRTGTAPGDIPGVASPALMRRLTRDDAYRGWIGDYLQPSRP